MNAPSSKEGAGRPASLLSRRSRSFRVAYGARGAPRSLENHCVAISISSASDEAALYDSHSFAYFDECTRSTCARRNNPKRGDRNSLDERMRRMSLPPCVPRSRRGAALRPALVQIEHAGTGSLIRRRRPGARWVARAAGRRNRARISLTLRHPADFDALLAPTTRSSVCSPEDARFLIDTAAR